MNENSSPNKSKNYLKTENDHLNGSPNFKKPKLSSVNGNLRDFAQSTVYSNGMLSPNAQSDLSDDDWSSTEITETGKMSSYAGVFYARIKEETKEFIHHIGNQMQTHHTQLSRDQQQSLENDESLMKMKLLIMIHTTCSQITNLLVQTS